MFWHSQNNMFFRLAYIIFLRVADVGGSKWGHCAEPKDNGCCGVQDEPWFLEKGEEIPDHQLMELPRDL